MARMNRYNLYDTTSFWVNKLNEVIINKLGSEMKMYNVTPSQWAALVPLFRGRVHTPASLAKYLGIDKAAVTRILGRLRKKGLIFRRKHKKDGRSYQIHLTNKAKQIVPELIISAQSCDSKFLHGLDNEEVFLFKAMINKILRNCEISAHI